MRNLNVMLFHTITKVSAECSAAQSPLPIENPPAIPIVAAAHDLHCYDAASNHS